jgi:hypothetical protein
MALFLPHLSAVTRTASELSPSLPATISFPTYVAKDDDPDYVVLGYSDEKGRKRLKIAHQD